MVHLTYSQRKLASEYEKFVCMFVKNVPGLTQPTLYSSSLSFRQDERLLPPGVFSVAQETFCHSSSTHNGSLPAKLLLVFDKLSKNNNQKVLKAFNHQVILCCILS